MSLCHPPQSRSFPLSGAAPPIQNLSVGALLGSRVQVLYLEREVPVSQKVWFIFAPPTFRAFTLSRFHTFTFTPRRSKFKSERQDPISNTRDPRHRDPRTRDRRAFSTTSDSDSELQIRSRNSLDSIIQSPHRTTGTHTRTTLLKRSVCSSLRFSDSQIPSHPILTHGFTAYDLRGTHPLPRRTPHCPRSPSHIPEHPQFPTKKKISKKEKSRISPSATVST
jgi:hypothetical protein